MKKVRLKGIVIGVCLLATLSSFDLPDESKFISRRIENIVVRDAQGKHTNLYDNMLGKPVLLSPVYTRCPMACSLISNGLKNTVEQLGTLGKDFTIITFSFDSTDTNADLKGFERRWKMDGKNWKTVTSSAQGIKSLLASIDYQIEYDGLTQEYAHPNVVIVITPSGRIARYIYGVEPKAKDLELAIMEAQVEKTSLNNFFKILYVRCFSFNPATKSYHVDWRFIAQTSAGLVMMIIMGTLLVRSLYFAKREEV
ncbi:MAG: SCO family protein [Bacteroidetes bacterium]|nr:SCO family protein [Bacteroidota bacterium]